MPPASSLVSFLFSPPLDQISHGVVLFGVEDAVAGEGRWRERGFGGGGEQLCPAVRTSRMEEERGFAG